MKKTNLFIFSLLIAIVSISCGKTNCECDESAPHFEVNQEIGIMEYRNQVDSWCISIDTLPIIDGGSFYLIKDIDKSFKKEGIRVKFSGDAVRSTFYQKSPFYGDEYYCITLTNIEEIK